MTITLRVGEVLSHPWPFVKGFRLAVAGVLLLSENDLRIFQYDETGLDEKLSLWIDDKLAVSEVRRVLSQPRPGAWWYFGKAMIEAWTRRDPDQWVLHEVVKIWLDDMEGQKPVCVKVRPHPWGWDEFG